MSAVLEKTTGIVSYSKQYEADLVRLAHALHVETVMRVLPLNEEKLKKNLKIAETHPNVYLRLWLNDSEVVGALYGLIIDLYWSDVPVATDRGIFVTPDNRGAAIAVCLLRDFEIWAKGRGARLALPSQTSGVNIEQTTRLFERCGYRHRGGNFIKEL